MTRESGRCCAHQDRQSRAVVPPWKRTAFCVGVHVARSGPVKKLCEGRLLRPDGEIVVVRPRLEDEYFGDIRRVGKIFVEAGPPSLVGRRVEEVGHLGIELASLARIDGEAGEDDDHGRLPGELDVLRWVVVSASRGRARGGQAGAALCDLGAVEQFRLPNKGQRLPVLG